MPKGGKKTFSWTKIRVAFVLAWKGNDVEAAREAGCGRPESDAARLMKMPEMKAAIEKKRRALFQQSAEQLAQAATISPGDIINGLAEIGRKGENESARVRAWDSLADIYGMKTRFSADLTDQLTQGKSKEELIYAGIHGRWAETRELAEAFVRGIPSPVSGKGSSDGNDPKR